MPRPATSQVPWTVMQRDRYRLLRSLGLPVAAAKRGCAGGARFAVVMAEHGHDPSDHPRLAAIRRGGDPLGRGLVKAVRVRVALARARRRR